ncbi:MAG: hypothetical protein P4L52_00935 [Acidocella sp.]|nr:hypothetical protein [Acidocella sp.]
MQEIINEFGAGIYSVAHVVMSGVGIIDNGFSVFMRAVGVANPGLQLDFLLLMVVAVVVLAMRIIGGGLGWIILLLCVLLLLHRVVPGLSAPGGLPVSSPLQGAIQQ